MFFGGAPAEALPENVRGKRLLLPGKTFFEAPGRENFSIILQSLPPSLFSGNGRKGDDSRRANPLFLQSLPLSLFSGNGRKTVGLRERVRRTRSH